jgi:hypothetical protein
MIKSIKENACHRLQPLTLIFNTFLDIRTAIRLKQLLELEQSANQKLVLKFSNIKSDNYKEALAII